MEGLVNRWKSAVNSQMKPKGKKPKTADPTDADPTEPALPSPLQVPPFIKSKAQEIVDVLSSKGADPPSSTSHAVLKFAKVCEILLEVAERRPEREDREGKSNHLKQVVEDLEAKYLDCEQEKVALRREKEALSGKVDQLQREVNLLLVTYLSLRHDAVEALKRSLGVLETANKALLGELEEERRQRKDEHTLWEVEMEHLRETLAELQSA